MESPLYTPYNESNGTQDGEVAVDMPRTALLTQERYLSSRTEAVQSIERTMRELQSMFQQLAGLVADQGEMIER